jgi:hypothetical protein
MYLYTSYWKFLVLNVIALGTTKKVLNRSWKKDKRISQARWKRMRQPYILGGLQLIPVTGQRLLEAAHPSYDCTGTHTT